VLNKSKTFSIDLSIFGGKVSDMAPGNLPAGSSPVCGDMFFGGQYTATRPALIHTLSGSGRAGLQVFSHNDYPQPNGQTETILLFDDGQVWYDNPFTTATAQIAQVTPGSRFKSIAAFNKFFMAFRGAVGGTFPNLSGYDMPQYINPQGNVRPVTQDAPGGGFSVTGITIAPEDLVTPGAWLTGPAVTNIAFGGERTITVNIPNRGTTTITEYTTATITLASAVTLAAGQVVQLYGITWANPNGPQWANGIPVAAAVTSSTTFTINISGVTQNNSATDGTFAVQASSAITLTRENNTVTAYLADTSPESPTQIQPGWYVNLIDTQATATSAVPISGAVPFTDNELFQAIYPSSATSGTVAALIEGAQMTFYTYSHSNGGAFNFDFPGDGFNEPLPAPIASYTFAASLTLMLNPNGNPAGSFLPGAPSGQPNPWQMYGVNSSGSWDDTTVIPYSGATTDVAAVISGYMSFPVAGNYTFQIVNDDGAQIGFEKGVTFVSSTGSVDGGQFNPQPHTLTALNGYPIVYAQNASTNFGHVDIYNGTVTVSVAIPGVYGFEANYVNWEGGAVFVMANVISGSPVPIQPTLSPANATVIGDGVGNIHVTLPTAIESLPIGSWLYLWLAQSTSSEVVDWTITSNGTGLITVQNGKFSVNEQITLNGFVSPQPTQWNGQTVEITSVTTGTNNSQTIQFNWNGTAGSGTTTSGTATPASAQYPQGWVQITQVISPTEFVYYATNNTETLTASGTVYDYFGPLNTQQALTAALPGQSTINSAQASASGQSSASGIVQGFQVLSVNTNTTPNQITWFQSGFNDSYSGTHTLQVQPQTQITGGPRSLLMFNINEDGGATPASYPLNVQLNGGTEFANVTAPPGPPGTVARAFAWTPAYGSFFFALSPGNVPATAGNAPIISLGTIIYDNTTLNTIMDFSDAALLNGICVGPVTPDNSAALSDDFGDLTSTIVLPPCAGVIEYNEQLGWWSELNCTPNHAMINMGFDGNYDGSLSLGSTAQPLGWDNSTEYNSITPDGEGFLSLSEDGNGFAYALKGTTGTLNFVIYSPSSGVLANVTFPMANFTSTNTWYTGNFSAAMPAAIPNDTVYFLYVSGGSANSMISQGAYQDYYGTPIFLPKKSYIMRFQAVQSDSNTPIDNLQIIDAAQPVLNNQLRFSYPDNEFGYDNENGFTVGLDSTDFVAGCFIQRQYLYAVTDGIGEQHTILANDQLPSEWDVSFHAKECACAGPDAVTSARSTSWWMGRHGVQVFHGDQPKKITQPVAQDFEQTNWNAASNSCMAADTVQRVVYMSFPTGVNTSANQSYTMNTRLANSEYDIPDPVRVSQYTGRMITTDLAEKWCPMSTPINSMGMCVRDTQNGFAKVMTFGGGKAGPVAANVSSSAQADSGDLIISLTPKNDDDFVLMCTSAFHTDSGNTPAGWTYSAGGYYTIQADSTDLLTFDAASPSPSQWSAVMASFAVSGEPTRETDTNIDFGTGPESQYTHTITANAGDAIVWQVTCYSQTAPSFSINDNQGNVYGVYQNTVQIDSGLYYTAYLAVALGAKAGSTTITFNISGYGSPSGSTGFQIFMFTYSGLAGPVGYGQLYMQDYWNYPPVTPSATAWNCLDADYGVIPWFYQTYFFISHDVEKQAQDALYRKLFGYMAIHVSGVGSLEITPYVSSLSNPWRSLAPFPLTLVDPGKDYNLGLNVLGERMSLYFNGVPAEEGQGTAMLLTHLIISLREDGVFPVSGLW
jgi:hypothetical protein